MMQKLWYALCLWLLGLQLASAAVNPDDLLPPEKAFVPTVTVSDQGVAVEFRIADGYYMYQSKITGVTEPAGLLAAPKFSEGQEKEDEFFGKQTVYHKSAQVNWPYAKTAPKSYHITLNYQGCAEAGVCYPPVETSFDIQGPGMYGNDTAAADDPKSMFVKPQGAASNPRATAAPPSPAPADSLSSSLHHLSRDTLGINLLAFFVFGLGLSFTACMYPLLPIVSSIIVGDKSGSKKRAFALSFVYVQGLALTYTAVGVLAGLTGALLTVWLQQAWVVLAMAGLMVLLALSMFGVFQLQLPAAVQTYF